MDLRQELLGTAGQMAEIADMDEANEEGDRLDDLEELMMRVDYRALSNLLLQARAQILYDEAALRAARGKAV